jgi:hypothetical protein
MSGGYRRDLAIRHGLIEGRLTTRLRQLAELG